MADPFSIATGALGLVALGIQVCDGARKLLKAAKGRHKELAAAWDDARVLAALFERLNGMIARIHAERPEDAALLSQCLEGARSPLLELRNVVAKLEGFPDGKMPSLEDAAWSSLSTMARSSGGMRNQAMDKAKDAVRAITYKLHQDDVKDLRVALQQLSTSINTAIQIVNLDEVEKQSQNMKSLQALMLSISSSVESKGSDLCLAISSLASQKQATVDDLQIVAQENAVRLRELQDGLSSDIVFIEHQLSTTNKAIHGVGHEVALVRDEVQAHGQAVLAQLQLIARQQEHQMQNPSTSSSTGTFQTINQIVQYVPPTSFKQALDVLHRCRCRTNAARSATSSLDLYNIRVFSRQQSLSRHERDCPLHALTQERTRAVGVRIRLQLGSLLSSLLEVNLCCSMGAGGSSFGPSIRWKNLVPIQQSPVQREFSRVSLWLRMGKRKRQPKRQPAELVEQLKMMQRNVLTLYRNGEASFNDVDLWGHNHLQLFIHTVVQSLDHELLTHDVASAAISMIHLYIEMGLTCDELHINYVRSRISSQWRSRRMIETSTTLARSTDLLEPYRGRITEQSVKLVSSIAQASEPVLKDVIRKVPYTDPGLFFTRVLDFETCMGPVLPLARAILMRSPRDLESAIRLSPESLLEKTHGLTVLHLAVGWPEGLSLLIQTDAKRLLDTPDEISQTSDERSELAWPFCYAAATQCAQSLDLLLRAGCDLYPIDPQSGVRSLAFSYSLAVTSAECAEIFAIHIAWRRRKLFALASSNLDNIGEQLACLSEESRRAVVEALEHNPYPKTTKSDAKAPERPFSEHLISNLVLECLEDAKVPVDPWLQPPLSIIGDIYQLPGLPLVFFPIFERHGFGGFNEPNRYGLRPIMQDPRSPSSLSTDPIDSAQSVLPWLNEHGCLDMVPAHTANQPHSDMVLNEGATGWHYLSLKIVLSTWGIYSVPAYGQRISKASMDLMATIAEGEAKRHRDGCVCLCTLPPASCRVDHHASKQPTGGCSPFSYLCKQWLQTDYTWNFRPHSFRHHLFRHGRNGGSGNTSSTQDNERNLASAVSIPTWQFEVLRLLTFESLDMTHTCCSAQPIQLDAIEHAIFNHPDSEGTRLRIEADRVEADKARQLEELMTEFTEQLGRTAGSPRDLEDFIFGPWRARVAGLFDETGQEVKAMEDFLGGKVRTRVLPERLQKFFDVDYPFFDDSNNASRSGAIGPSKLPSMEKKPFQCETCFWVDG